MTAAVFNSVLGYIGRHGTTALAISIFIGVALPSFSSYLRPYLTLAVLLLLTLAFLKVDHAVIKARLKRPAFLYMLGLNSALSLAISVAALLVTPVTATFLGQLMLGSSLPLSVASLAAKLSVLLVGALIIAICIRKVVGTKRLERNSDMISGLNVILLLIFAVAAMDGVAESISDRPLVTLGVVGLTFVVALGQIVLTFFLFLPMGREDAYAIAHTCGTRNMGLMVAAFGGSLPEFTWLWFALGQFPIYLLPMLMKPFVNNFIIPGTKSKYKNTPDIVG